MKVSIITVCYNSEKTIEQTIRSIIEQSFENIEYIIIDGGSDDGTKEIIERYRDHISVYISEPDNGIYDAMNKGIRISTGDVIGIVNSDDWLEPDTVETVELIFRKEHPDIVYGNVYEVNDEEKIQVLRSQPAVDDKNLWKSMPIWHPATFVKREVYEKLGDYSTDYAIASDYDFVIRCFLGHMRFRYIDKELSNFRNDGLSSRQLLLCARENQKLIENYRVAVSDYGQVSKFYNEYIKSLIFEEKASSSPEEIVECLTEMTGGRKEIVLWGLGKMGRICFGLFQKTGIRISRIVDAGKAGENHYGYEITAPDSVCKSAVPVLIAIMGFSREGLPSHLNDSNTVLLEEWIDRLTDVE